MKKLMILGASYTQIPLYEAARRLGVHTIAASIPGDYPGFDCADESAFVNIADPEAVTQAAREMHADGIATCGLDLGMRAIGRACQELGLPGPSREAAEKASNKYKMKQALTAAGVQTARFYCIHDEAELEAAMDQLEFPVILKAVDLMGSRGIFRSNTKEEARKNFCKSMEATAQDYCLIEEFIEGALFGVEGMIQNGQILFLLPNNTEAFISSTPTPVGHSIPLRDLETLGEQIREQASGAIRALGLDNCPVNCDFIRKDNKVYVVELTGRSGATGLSEMTGIYYGINYYETIVRLAMGEDVSGDFAHPTGCACLTHTLGYDREGRVRCICNENTPLTGREELSFNIKAGDQVRPYTNGRDRIGQVILTDQSLDRCQKRLKEILSGISLELEKDLPLMETPIQLLSHFGNQDPSEGHNRSDVRNRIYMKREDMLPFSFGGNKVRFAQSFLEDMERRHCDAMIIYGGYHSNLCRILAAACAGRGIPCSMIHNVDDVDPDEISCNKYLIQSSGVREYLCRKGEIAPVVQEALDDFIKEGYNPYYIYGNIYGQGNAWVPMESYVKVYQEIRKQEENMGIHFDYIFLASSTNTTQSGLVAGHLMAGDDRKIVGISVTRKADRALNVMRENLQQYHDKKGSPYRLCCDPELLLEDAYLAGGYGNSNEAIRETIRRVYQTEGIGLDPTYTGKAFWGMMEYLKTRKICDKNILFIHTGGTPLFFDILPELKGTDRK